jgi:hypothetical protein
MATIEYKEGKDFASLPAREPVLVTIKSSHYETEDNPFASEENDEPRTRDVVKVIFEALEDEYAGTRVWKTFTASIHEKSLLRPLIQAVHPRDLTLDELKAFDTDDLEGKRLYIIGEYDDKKDAEHKFLRPTGYIRLKSSERKASEGTTKRETAAAKTQSESKPERASAPATNAPRDVDPDEIPF